MSVRMIKASLNTSSKLKSQTVCSLTGAQLTSSMISARIIFWHLNDLSTNNLQLDDLNLNQLQSHPQLLNSFANSLWPCMQAISIFYLDMYRKSVDMLLMQSWLWKRCIDVVLTLCVMPCLLWLLSFCEEQPPTPGSLRQLQGNQGNKWTRQPQATQATGLWLWSALASPSPPPPTVT